MITRSRVFLAIPLMAVLPLTYCEPGGDPPPPPTTGTEPPICDGGDTGQPCGPFGR